MKRRINNVGEYDNENYNNDRGNKTKSITTILTSSSNNKSSSSKHDRKASATILSFSILIFMTCIAIIPYYLYNNVLHGNDVLKSTTAASSSSTLTTKQRRIMHRQEKQNVTTKTTTMTSTDTDNCAICFFGLPRSFELLVLPSIKEYILPPNNDSNCDIYFHYYQINEERTSRSGSGGKINTDNIPTLLQDTIRNFYQGRIHLSIVNDTEESFHKIRGQQLHKYMTTKGSDGKLLYFPWMAKTFDKTSVHNIIKQWHSISSVWTEMERCQTLLKKSYTRVAMLRNDVVYVTPFNIHESFKSHRDAHNQFVSVPDWARFPINDRMVYGPYDAIKIWATERFDRLETHVLTYEPGYGLHNERFLNHSIFPPIRDLGYTVVGNPQLCFLRARADGSVWINDCATRYGAAEGFRNLNTAQTLVEKLVGHPCLRSKFRQRTVQIQCNLNNTGGTNDVAMTT
jgi:hypothetical protein